jgi:chromosome segregation ATPase
MGMNPKLRRPAKAEENHAASKPDYDKLVLQHQHLEAERDESETKAETYRAHACQLSQGSERQAKDIKALREENAKLRRGLGERSSEIGTLKAERDAFKASCWDLGDRCVRSNKERYAAILSREAAEGLWLDAISERDAARKELRAAREHIEKLTKARLALNAAIDSLGAYR